MRSRKENKIIENATRLFGLLVDPSSADATG